MLSLASPVTPRALIVLASAVLCFAQAPQAVAQIYPSMSAIPDPRDFFSRADTHLNLLGDPMRLAGANIAWLGLRSDTGQAAAARLPTDHETEDALVTLQALGGTIVRARTLGASVGCALCIMPSPGKFNDAAFAHIDTVLADARDLGIKLIVPLAGGPQDCAKPDPYDGSLCAFVRARGGHDARAFFTDAAIRADFLAYVAAVVTHIDNATGQPYAQNPTIMAWENCDACGAGMDPAEVAGWSEAVGQAVHAADKLHLYENGAFAGHIDPKSPSPAPSSAWATPSVDIVGDVSGPQSDVLQAAAAVGGADRVYMVDSFDWTAKRWKTPDDLEAFLNNMARQRLLSGALFDGLEAHAEQGGFLPPPPGATPLYFPGVDKPYASADDMQARGRLLRHFAYRMATLPVPPFLTPPKPDILSVTAGRVAWRGSAGARAYRIERSFDLVTIGSWSVVCDNCQETSGGWQDPHTPTVPAWYRVAPIDSNGHIGEPSLPAQNKLPG